MIPTLRAEFRKLFTVRSTYIVCALALVIIGFFSFYGSGFKGAPVFGPEYLQSTALNAIAVTSLFIGVLSILIICHEYRYNTIAYSLTIATNRTKVLGAKLVVSAALAIIMTLLVVLLAIVLTMWGAAAAGHPMYGQQIDEYTLLWRSLAFMLGSAWLGLAIGFLVRSVVAAISVYFLTPIIEPLFTNVLKVNGNYLPSTAHGQILLPNPVPGSFSPLESLVVFSIYLAIILIAASTLFVRRDALS